MFRGLRTLYGESKAGRNSLNGDPNWAGIPGLDTIIVTAEQKKLIIDEPDILELIASDDALAPALRSIDGEGGGWNLACPKGGVSAASRA